MKGGGSIRKTKDKFPKFRATEDEYEILIARAHRKNMSLSDYLRTLAFGEDAHIEVKPGSFMMDMDLKEEYLSFRVSPEEKRIIDAKAKKSNMNRSKYVSFSALEKDIVVFEGLREFTYQLSKIGANLNQVTMLANQGKVTVIDIEDVRTQVTAIWKALRGLTKTPKKRSEESDERRKGQKHP